MDRMGNILWRTFGENVFLVALHKPEPCGGWDKPTATLCAPLGGAIDCAATRAGGNPVGFDVLHSPIAEAKFEERSFYAISHPLLRLFDYTDGYIWQVPVDDAPMVDLIPLAEYSPTDAADEKKRAAWQKRADDHANPMRRPSWKTLPDWRASCAPAESPQRGGSSE